ncbi:MAG: S1 family peptidase [Chloroflexota bacterium]|nr:S1 family peptidase [Chloroflexota bacterium]
MPLSAGVAPSAPTEEELAAAIADRAAYGLPSSSDYVLTLMASPSDVGTAAWGIPLTTEEMAQLDLATRSEFEVAAKDVVAFARSLPEFGGAYFDQLAGGGLVLQFTNVSESTIQGVSELAPQESLTTRLETVKHSFAALEEAMLNAPTILGEVEQPVNLVSVGISEPSNSLIAKILDTGLDAASLAAKASDRLGILVAIEIVPSSLVPGTCTSRSSCTAPTMAGIRIGNGIEGCSMGFHVVNGSDKQFVGAGHCGGGTWYHPGQTSPLLLLGTVQSDLYDGGSLDIQRVQLPNTQASKVIYGEGSRLITGWDWPVTGAIVCASLGYKQVVDCGNVTISIGGYTLEGFLRWGTDTTGIVTQGGDSGSPLYVRGSSTLRGLGVYSAGNSTDRWFARLGDGLAHWSGWDIFH